MRQRPGCPQPAPSSGSNVGLLPIRGEVSSSTRASATSVPTTKRSMPGDTPAARDGNTEAGGSLVRLPGAHDEVCAIRGRLVRRSWHEIGEPCRRPSARKAIGHLNGAVSPQVSPSIIAAASVPTPINPILMVIRSRFPVTDETFRTSAPLSRRYPQQRLAWRG